MATKEKLSKSLKDKFRNELTEQKTKEKLERIEANKKLNEAIIYTNKDHKLCQSVITHFTQEGIPFVEKEVSINEAEWQKVAATTNLAAVPTVIAGNEYFVHQRDFQNPQQLANMVIFHSSPDFQIPYFEDKLLERLKTQNYNLWNKLNILEQKISPMIQFIENLQKQLALEEDSE